jgi:hypothetical protein
MFHITKKMPFSTETAVAAGRKGGGKRWRDPSTVRKKRIQVSVSEQEETIIVRAVASYEPNMNYCGEDSKNNAYNHGKGC